MSKNGNTTQIGGRKKHSVPRIFQNLIQILKTIEDVESVEIGRWTRQKKSCSRLEIKFYDPTTKYLKINCYYDNYISPLFIHFENGHNKELVEEFVRNYKL